MEFETVGAKIAKRRVGLGISRDKLAELCGLSKAYIWKVEKDVNLPSPSTLTAIARVLQLSFDELSRISDRTSLAKREEKKRGDPAGSNILKSTSWEETDKRIAEVVESMTEDRRAALISTQESIFLYRLAEFYDVSRADYGRVIIHHLRRARFSFDWGLSEEGVEHLTMAETLAKHSTIPGLLPLVRHRLMRTLQNLAEFGLFSGGQAISCMYRALSLADQISEEFAFGNDAPLDHICVLKVGALNSGATLCTRLARLLVLSSQGANEQSDVGKFEHDLFMDRARDYHQRSIAAAVQLLKRLRKARRSASGSRRDYLNHVYSEALYYYGLSLRNAQRERTKSDQNLWPAIRVFRNVLRIERVLIGQVNRGPAIESERTNELELYRRRSERTHEALGRSYDFIKDGKHYGEILWQNIICTNLIESVEPYYVPGDQYTTEILDRVGQEAGDVYQEALAIAEVCKNRGLFTTMTYPLTWRDAQKLALDSVSVANAD